VSLAKERYINDIPSVLFSNRKILSSKSTQLRKPAMGYALQTLTYIILPQR